jgi:hypothetical protein
MRQFLFSGLLRNGPCIARYSRIRVRNALLCFFNGFLRTNRPLPRLNRVRVPSRFILRIVESRKLILRLRGLRFTPSMVESDKHFRYFAEKNQAKTAEEQCW